MQLIGMFDSPYVRRVAVALKHPDVPFEHANRSVGADFERIREFSPLGRVPVLVPDDGTALDDSKALLAHVERCEALPEFRATHARWFVAALKK